MHSIYKDIENISDSIQYSKSAINAGSVFSVSYDMRTLV